MGPAAGKANSTYSVRGAHSSHQKHLKRRYVVVCFNAVVQVRRKSKYAFKTMKTRVGRRANEREDGKSASGLTARSSGKEFTVAWGGRCGAAGACIYRNNAQPLMHSPLSIKHKHRSVCGGWRRTIEREAEQEWRDGERGHTLVAIVVQPDPVNSVWRDRYGCGGAWAENCGSLLCRRDGVDGKN